MHTQHGAPPMFHPWGGGGCGPVSTLSFLKRPWGLGRGQSYSLGLLQGRALAEKPPGVGPLFFSLPWMSVL